jgi:hypothetical protein
MGGPAPRARGREATRATCSSSSGSRGMRRAALGRQAENAYPGGPPLHEIGHLCCARPTPRPPPRGTPSISPESPQGACGLAAVKNIPHFPAFPVSRAKTCETIRASSWSHIDSAVERLLGWSEDTPPPTDGSPMAGKTDPPYGFSPPPPWGGVTSSRGVCARGLGLPPRPDRS